MNPMNVLLKKFRETQMAVVIIFGSIIHLNDNFIEKVKTI